MPIYDAICLCGFEGEVFTRTTSLPLCQCGRELTKKEVYYPAMVKYGHGYPSRRKMRNGTAPYCGAQKADYGNYTEREAVTVHGAPYT